MHVVVHLSWMWLCLLLWIWADDDGTRWVRSVCCARHCMMFDLVWSCIHIRIACWMVVYYLLSHLCPSQATTLRVSCPRGLFCVDCLIINVPTQQQESRRFQSKCITQSASLSKDQHGILMLWHQTASGSTSRTSSAARLCSIVDHCIVISTVFRCVLFACMVNCCDHCRHHSSSCITRGHCALFWLSVHCLVNVCAAPCGYSVYQDISEHNSQHGWWPVNLEFQRQFGRLSFWNPTQ